MRGNLVIVANLQGMRRIACWLMPDRLAMAADSDDVRRLELFLAINARTASANSRPRRVSDAPAARGSALALQMARISSLIAMGMG
jgi:hypothetical protein